MKLHPRCQLFDSVLTVGSMYFSRKIYIILVESLSDTVRDGLQDLAYQAAGLAHGNSDVTFETMSPASQFHNYRPVTVPTSSVDHSCCPVEAVNKKTSSKTPAS